MPNSSIWARAAELFASPTWLNTMGATSPARIAMTVMTTRSSIRVKPTERRKDGRGMNAPFSSPFRPSVVPSPLVVSNTQHLLDRRDPRLDLRPSVLAQRAHPLGGRDVPQSSRIGSAEKGLLDLFRDDQQLEDPGSPAIARAAARGAPAAALEHHLLDRLVG